MALVSDESGVVAFGGKEELICAVSEGSERLALRCRLVRQNVPLVLHSKTVHESAFEKVQGKSRAYESD